MTIECLKFQSQQKGSLIGFADFYIAKTGLEIYNCSVYQKDGRRWVNFPSREYTTPDGEKKYLPYLRFRDPNHKEKFGELALKAIDKKCAEAPSALAQEEVPF